MKYYIVGLKEKRMTALALLLSDLGYNVIGKYDDNELLKSRIELCEDFNEVFDSETLVIYSSNFDISNSDEINKAKELEINIYEYQEIISRLIKRFRTICVTGSYGKTATVNMLSRILSDVFGCNYIMDNGIGHGDKNSNIFALECEDTEISNFNNSIEYAVITNIDEDYKNNYESVDEMVLSYQEFANNAFKMVIACGDNPYTHLLDVNPQIYYYGISEDNDIQARNIEYKIDGTSFDVFVEDEYYGHFDLPIYGKHMLLDALAAIAICHYERIDSKDVIKSLKNMEYSNVSEEQIKDNILVDFDINKIIDIKSNIKSYRQKYPDKKIIIVFDPSDYSNSDELVNSLNLADFVYIINEQYSFIDKLSNKDIISVKEISKLLDCNNSVILFENNENINSIKEEYKRLKEINN